ncbi:M23 family metallopeptidase [Photobacterium sanguinicancri]|uniref:M23 family metallopeptidase n=1 Tax=Photobacterium sanguinicancri TaxID=875932 RepID=A0AAW7Y3U8_9GAMM|nr:M23 family metallopeptidase [Photobacterium sanguinicancri]KXI21849.1 peptidase M23 [Photobacterium sanguinicancri]MDO6497753.1 M23 family metallopeptidase [Photobacterium sanguinicancri]MDO6543263.1 M23 family metallopeptidase [Photobacterium sanguinicancri]OZS45858.1 peptidase M23 [Photobacterium sanguinicancri]
MSDTICISVSHRRGTSHYLINRFKKRYAAFLVLLLGGMLSYGSLNIYQLYQQNEVSNVQLSQLNVQAEQLSDSLSEENATNLALSQELEDKKNELMMLEQRIDDVETILGLQAENTNIPLEQRVDSAAISSAVRGTLFRLIPNGSPTPDTRMSSRFGTRIHPVTGKRKRHNGLDFAANIGTPIYAPADGVIENVRPSNKGSGNFIKLDHSFGFMSTYSHMKKFNVKRGQFVRKGDLLGWTGNSGLSTGPHLHYEIRFLGRALNPHHFVVWTPDNFDSLFEKEKSVQWATMLEMINNVVSMQVQLTQAPSLEPTIKTANTAPRQSEQRQL